jgi:hypothetical protein
MSNDSIDPDDVYLDIKAEEGDMEMLDEDNNNDSKKKKKVVN